MAMSAEIAKPLAAGFAAILAAMIVDKVGTRVSLGYGYKREMVNAGSVAAIYYLMSLYFTNL